MRVLISSLNILMTLAWPFLAWFSIVHPEHRWLLAVLALMCVLRFTTLRGDENNIFKRTALWLAVAGVVLSVASLLLRDGGWLLWYPVAVNSVMLMLFGGSLYSGMPLVERLARLQEPDLPAQAISYTRRVTKVWCWFFIVNGSIAVLTCLVGNLHWWTLWNGVISYVLMGMLMGGEWLIRQRLRKRV
ncbi:hypothetical protein ACIPUP_09935 [Pectobacterium actinidiae]|uniref:DNA gyrase subunit B n=1 Tax=Pectobacterium actinidiae TaxID=1507808 RepID=A0ABW8G9W3_9GAMM